MILTSHPKYFFILRAFNMKFKIAMSEDGLKGSAYLTGVS